jgi:hypothetical protein
MPQCRLPSQARPLAAISELRATVACIRRKPASDSRRRLATWRAILTCVQVRGARGSTANRLWIAIQQAALKDNLLVGKAGSVSVREF